MTSRGVAALTAVSIALIAAPSAHAEPWVMCPSGISGVANDSTSCEFADSVAIAWRNSPRYVVDAYSPVTGRLYRMSCAPNTVSINGGEWGPLRRRQQRRRHRLGVTL